MKIKNICLFIISLLISIFVIIISSTLISYKLHSIGIAGIFIGISLISISAVSIINVLMTKKINLLIPFVFLLVTLEIFSTVSLLDSSGSSSIDSIPTLQLLIEILGIVSLVFATKNKKWASICGLIIVLLSISSYASSFIFNWGKVIEIKKAMTNPDTDYYLVFEKPALQNLIVLISNFPFVFYYIFNLAFPYESNKQIHEIPEI